MADITDKSISLEPTPEGFVDRRLKFVAEVITAFTPDMSMSQHDGLMLADEVDHQLRRDAYFLRED